ncbi:hypothetical protein N7532_010955 [Penicillium argentinense]|uniref:Apple domain-containing protein n=1 Tax=Penicillium argentinense TaxID=1131581 RepID=A0A9W9EQY0_9EURO|nr:uncharacterized protein N7532_010955 [Penicillium argentinense]KAJ5086184.1 hypothetical protein N7532_010955 [Penicillium argentinense]
MRATPTSLIGIALLFGLANAQSPYDKTCNPPPAGDQDVETGVVATYGCGEIHNMGDYAHVQSTVATPEDCATECAKRTPEGPCSWHGGTCYLYNAGAGAAPWSDAVTIMTRKDWDKLKVAYDKCQTDKAVTSAQLTACQAAKVPGGPPSGGPPSGGPPSGGPPSGGPPSGGPPSGGPPSGGPPSGGPPSGGPPSGGPPSGGPPSGGPPSGGPPSGGPPSGGGSTPVVHRQLAPGQCPPDDGRERTVDGVTYTVMCKKAYSTGVPKHLDNVTEEYCVKACSSDSTCQGANFNTDTNNCELHSSWDGQPKYTGDVTYWIAYRPIQKR